MARFLPLLIFLLSGCSTQPEIVTETVYETVEVPVYLMPEAPDVLFDEFTNKPPIFVNCFEGFYCFSVDEIESFKLYLDQFPARVDSWEAWYKAYRSGEQNIIFSEE